MAYPWTVYKTWTTGEILTAADLNNSFSAAVSNSIPSSIDDYSTNSTVMQTTTDPYPSAAVSLPTTLAGELERIRYMIKQITGKSQWYVDAAAIGSKGADVSSATSPLPVLTDGNFFDVTGTSAITEIATLGVGSVIFLQFDGASSLTHHSTNLILPGGTNITNAAGDVACFIEYAAGDWFLVAHSGLLLHRGTQTVTGVKTFRAAQGNISSIPAVRNSAVIFDNFDRSNRTLNADTTPTGQTWSLSGDGAATAEIENGIFKSDANGNSTDNVYAVLDYGTEVFKIYGAFSFVPTPGTDRTISSLALVLDEGAAALADLAHLIISPNGWTLQKRVSGGSFTSISSGNHNLYVDGSVYGIGIEIDGDEITVIAPNGKRTTVTDSDVGGHTFRYGIWQITGNSSGYGGRWHAAVLGESNFESLKGIQISSSWDMANRGTVTNDNASAGYIGEYSESIISTAQNAPTSTQYGDLTSLSLTAGDWDVMGMVTWVGNGATWTAVRSGISLTSGNSTTGLTAGSNIGFSSFGSTSTVITGQNHTLLMRYSFSSTTTVYLKYRADYSAGTPQAQGSLKARRVR